MEAFIVSLFRSVLNMSITASVVIAAVLFLRLPLKKVSGSVSYVLWFVVLFRLLCPFSWKSTVSLFGMLGSNTAMEHIPADIGTMAHPQINMIVPSVTDAINASLPAATPVASANPMQIILAVLAYFWAFGLFILLIYSMSSYQLLKRRVGTAIRVQDNIYQSDRIDTPFVCGFIRPRIILPVTLGHNERSYILRHEQTHIKRRDYLVKPLWFLAACLHWFNPLVWLAFQLMSRDMEMRCDEAVIQETNQNIKADYCSSLLTLSGNPKFAPGSPLAFGETGVKARVKHVLNYKRPAFWVIAVAVVAVVSATVILAVNPKENKTEQSLISRFFQYKTDYVGNNSKVGGIISLLAFPADVQYESFELKTDAEPYEVTLKLSTRPAPKEYYAVASNQQQFEHNATIMLSLIGNAGIINFKLSDGSDDSTPLELVYTREKINQQYGQDVRLFAGSEEAFAKLLYSQEKPKSVQEQKVVGYTLMKLRKGGVVHTALSPLSGDVAQLADDVIFNFMIKSAAWPGVDIKTLDECWLLRATYSDGTTADYYTFKHQGYAVMQHGADGMYSRIDDGLYQKLTALQESLPAAVNKGASQAASASTDLNACVTNAILSKNANQYGKSDFAAESHVILKTVEGGNTTTVYAMALYQEFRYSGGGFSETGGSHMPVAITFIKNTAGEYSLTEYWKPQDGSYYALSIKNKFPADIYENALDTQKYITAQIQACYEQAVAYGKVDVNPVIKRLLETITKSPAYASNPGAYIDAHPIEYRELLYYGKHTLRYCITLFEQGRQTDLNGHIMAAACRSIIGTEDIQILAGTGQEWYDAFKRSTEDLRNKKGNDSMEKNMPWSYFFLKTIDSIKK